MPLALVNRNSAALVTMTMPGGSAKSYNAQFQSFSVSGSKGEVDVTTFAGETSGEFDSLTPRYVVTFAGLTKTGVDGSNGAAVIGDLLTLPDGVACTWQWASGASVGGEINVNNFGSNRVAGGVSTFAGAGLFDGSLTIAWPET